jgi:hypothetical protein
VGLGSQSKFQFIPKMNDGIVVRALQASHILHVFHAETEKSLSQTVATVGSTESSSMSLYAVLR